MARGKTLTAAGPRVLSEGRFRISAEPDGALVVEWRRDGDPEGSALTLPAAIGALIARVAGGERFSPAAVLRAMRGAGLG